MHQMLRTLASEHVHDARGSNVRIVANLDATHQRCGRRLSHIGARVFEAGSHQRQQRLR
jgi:hypothetical protein